MPKKLFAFQHILSAYYRCRRKKRLKTSSAEFELVTESEIFKLENSLQGDTYCPDRFSVFAVSEPKTREIFAAQFKDRVIHHLLCSHLLPIFEPKFIFHSYACRKNKGTHKAVATLYRYIRPPNPKRQYYLQADIRNFFCSINREILYTLIKKHVTSRNILQLTERILFHDCTFASVKKGQLDLFACIPPEKSLFHALAGCGLPIGNLTSQFFANVYLNELDQYVVHTLKCRRYLRYVDDFVIVHENKEYLVEIKKNIETFLHDKLKLSLHPRKWKISPVSNGIDMLGYVVKPTHILVRRRVVTAFKKKLAKFHSMQDMSIPEMLSSINSYYAHFRHADSYRLRKHLWDRHFGTIKRYFKPAEDYKYFKMKPG